MLSRVCWVGIASLAMLLALPCLAAEAMPDTVRGVLAAGASDYLTKPLDIQKFLKVVGGALGRG